MERMKRVLCVLLCLVLVLGMLPMSALAAPGRGKGNGGRGNSGKGNNKGNGNSTVVTEPTQPSTGDTQLLAVENENTVANPDMLRASTYVLTASNDVAEAVESGTYDLDTAAEDGSAAVLKYFNVTMYNYDQDTINNATHKVEYEANPDLTKWSGMYFSGGSPDPVSYTVVPNSVEVYSPTVNNDGTVTVEDGTYFIYSSANECYMTGVTNSNGWWNDATFIPGQTDRSLAETMTITAVSGGYTIQNSSNEYLQIPSNNNGTYVTESNVLSFVLTNSGTLVLKDNNTGVYLNALGNTDYDAFGGWTEGSPLTLYSVVEGEGTDLLSFGAWNRWDKASGNNSNGQKFWTGLVESNLDANKDIVFKVPEGGIFNSDATVKNIYTNVQMPFLYENATYTFDASVNGVYFLANDIQGSTAVGSNSRLYFDEGNPQGWDGMYYGDGSENLWAPFNTNDNDTSENAIDYHFGMRTTIPFTMTTNGRMNEKVADSEPIHFSFSGDDDVWVFIDGQLVIDLGGIHNRLNADIDFAANTITYWADNNADINDDGVMDETGSYNDADFLMTETLFGGVIAQDRATFAATDSHELTIFYLERGMGSSNCKISFNLPMKDTVTVTKHATKSWEDETQTESNLTAKEQAAVDNMDFGFTLVKSEDGGNTFVPVANTNYRLVNENGQVISVPSTDSNGHFTLKNGQSARFVTTFTTSGVIYYVIEDDVSDLGFLTPDFNFAGTAAGGFQANGNTYSSADLIGEQIIDLNATENKSYAVTVYGSDEAEDSIVFICENYLDQNLPNPSARPADDRIVIDYGLPVIIDVLSNDLFRGDTLEIIGVYGDGATLTDAAKATVYDTELDISQIVTGTSEPVYGSAVLENGKITYQLNQQLTGVEVLNYVIKVTGTAEKNEATHETVTAYSYGIAQVYIMPATTMYYEENFASLITFTNDGGDAWQKELVTESSYISANQEPGVVGTVGDSPYGSDVEYLNDSHDSNGTSKYAHTDVKAAKFEYTFTGTASSIYARTGANTGMMKITIVETASGDLVFEGYRNTKYVKSESSAELNFDYLYNIPVYSTGNLGFGTYTVTIIIGRGTTANGYGTEFWLDGIRVYQPLDPAEVYPDEDVTAPVNYDKVASAYATDGEANMANETLRDKILIEADYTETEDGEMIPVWTEGGNFVLLTDINGQLTTAEEYQGIGPKEEVYLYNGQTVSFSLYDWDPNTNKIYLGIKAPTGSGTVTIGGKTLQINNATDCYYDISSYATITTDADGIKTATFTITSGSGSLISVTNIKVSGQFEFTIIGGNVDEES